MRERSAGAPAGTTIGKRYARTDELGIPFAITVDRDTLEGAMQGSVTVRERDSTSQVGPDQHAFYIGRRVGAYIS